MNPIPLSRRSFLETSAGLAAGALLPLAPRKKLKLGFDNFAVRAMGWKAPQLIDHAAALKVDVLLISDLDAYDTHDEAHLKDVKKKADDAGLQLLAGTGGICPTSSTWKNKWGTPEEHLKLTIRLAKALGSPVARCYLGRGEDRAAEGGIDRHIAEVVKVFKAVRSIALDAGIKIAIENHAGDMQSWELVSLIEEAGKDFVGAMIDPGNAVWALEDPLHHLEILGPYTICSSVRDSAIWDSPNGAYVQWTAMGEGQVDWKTYFERWQVLCPETSVNLELISGFSREFPFLKPDFWKPWPKVRTHEFAKFVAMARKGTARQPFKPEGDRKKAEQEYQKNELEKSVRYCKDVLGLGLK